MIKARFCAILLVISIVVGMVCPSEGVIPSSATNPDPTSVLTSESDNAAVVAAFVAVAVVVVICIACNSQPE